LWLGYLAEAWFTLAHIRSARTGHVRRGGGGGGSKMLMWHRCDALFVLVKNLKIKGP